MNIFICVYVCVLAFMYFHYILNAYTCICHHVCMYLGMESKGCVVEFNELAAIKENFILLCNMITDVIDPLMKCFVESNILSAEEHSKILGITEATERIRLVLQKLSFLLELNDKRAFYIMLQIMKQHGGKATQVLGDHIINRIKISYDELLQIVADSQCKGLLTS